MLKFAVLGAAIAVALPYQVLGNPTLSPSSSTCARRSRPAG